MRTLVVGLSHHTASVELRERCAVDDPAPVLAKLVACDEVDEAVLVSTCNRVEVIVTTRRLEAARHRLRGLFSRELADGADVAAVGGALYEHADSRALQHVLRVASSLDSMVVGEPQILGQVKDAYHAAVEAGACGVILNRLFSRAFACAKRVRSETRIGERPLSVARVAVDLARQIFESLESKSALMIGAGDMGEVALDALRREGLARLAVANRTLPRARDLAARFGATAHGLDDLGSLLAGADVVLVSVGGGEPLLRRETLEGPMRHRGHRPMFVIDIGVPRNVDPALNELEAVYLYDLDDLEGVAASNAAQREREVDRAERIVEEEQQRFDGWLTALKAVPTIRHLRDRAESMRRSELERFFRRLDLDPAQREGVEVLTRALVNKLLHAPVQRLRSERDSEEGMAYLEAARFLFGLDEPDAEEDGVADGAGRDEPLGEEELP